MNKQLLQVALTLLPGVGDRIAKQLISYCGSVEEIFSARKSHLLKIPSIGPVTANAISKHSVFSLAEKELTFIERYKISPLFYTEDNYPKRLKNCEDAPIMLYYKGNVDLNTQKVLSIVGTRNATPYGKEICEELAAGMAEQGILIVSGLAYGIDGAAHKSALKHGANTIAVLGHGLSTIYPAQHKVLAEKIIYQGGLLTDFRSDQGPERENFPKRNRIIAGMTDATIVVEAGAKGGALITADIAGSYNRDVFAFPGRIKDAYSEGCHFLIRTNRASLVTSFNDIAYALGWDVNSNKVENTQSKLMINLEPDEQKIVSLLNENSKLAVDELMLKTEFSLSKLAGTLLNLEMNGIVRGLPGKVYELN